MGILRLGPFIPATGWVERFSDDFNRSNGAVGANYEFFGDASLVGSGNLHITDGVIAYYGETNTSRRCRYRILESVYDFGADQAAEFVVGQVYCANGGAFYIGAGIHGSGSGSTSYGFMVVAGVTSNTSELRYELWRQNGTSAWTLIGLVDWPGSTEGDIVRIRMKDGDVIVSVNNVDRLTVAAGTIGAYTAGQPFIVADGAYLTAADCIQIDDFAAYEWVEP